MWISNPFADPLFQPTLRVVGGLLGGILPVLLVVERKHLRELNRRELFERWRTWVVIAPLYGLAILAGTVTTMLLVAFLVFQGLREYARLVGLPKPYRRVLLAAGLVTVPSALLPYEYLALLPTVLLLSATLRLFFLQSIEERVRHLALAAFGWGYIALLLGHILLMFLYVQGGPGLLLALGLAVALSDVGAFTIGKLLGRHRLAPSISPHKTWEGVAGNLLGASVGIGLMSFALPTAMPFSMVLALPAVMALGAVWGDLLESALKRKFQAKDTGTWLPGFGGLLDRVDSLIIVVPLTYYLMKFAGGL